jgi:uncharacterized protein YciI
MKYLVLAIRRPAFRPEVGEAHQAFLAGLRQEGMLVMNGPFGDKTGGAYVLQAESLEQAQAIAHCDPLHVEGCSDLSVWEWDVR